MFSFTSLLLTIHNTQLVLFNFFQALHSAAPYFFCSQRPEHPSSTLSDLTVLALLLISSTPPRIPSAQPPPSPFMACSIACPFFITPDLVLWIASVLLDVVFPSFFFFLFEPITHLVLHLPLCRLCRPLCSCCHFIQLVLSFQLFSFILLSIF